MIRQILDLDRLKGAETNMQDDLRRRDTALSELVEQRLREVHPRRRCRDRSGNIGIDRLVSVPIVSILPVRIVPSDIGRQRRRADLVQHDARNIRRIDRHLATTARMHPNQSHRPARIPQPQAFTRLEPTRTPKHDLPATDRRFPNEQAGDPTAGRSMGDELRR